MASTDPARTQVSHGSTPLRQRLLRTRRILYHLLERSERSRDASWLVDSLLVILIVLNVAAVLLESVTWIGETYASSFRMLELISVIVFTIEYAGRIWVCVEAPQTDSARSHSIRRLRYATTPMALIDLIAVLPFYLGAIGLLGATDTRMLRVLRLLRLFKLTRYADSISLLLRVIRENASNFGAALGILLVVMTLAASGMYVIEREVQPEHFGNIPSAMWWAFVTLTTVGYGDVTPVTAVGKVFASTIIVVSIGIVALPAGLLASSFSARLRESAEAYRSEADKAAKDGLITDDERRALEAKRRELGLGEDLADDILEKERTRRFYRGAPDSSCPHCGGRLGD